MSTTKDIKVMRDMATTLNIRVSEEFAHLAEKCQHREVRPGPNREDDDWDACTNKKHPYALANIVLCNVQNCPRLR